MNDARSDTGAETTEVDAKLRSHAHLARRAALAFALFGSLWILASDWLLALVAPDLRTFLSWQTYKGWFFIAISTLIIYGVLARTERRRAAAAAALVANERHYRLLFASNPHPMWVYDLETLRFLEVNDAAIANYGYTREEFCRMTLFDIRPAEEAARLQADVVRTTNPLHYAGEWRHRKKNGEIITVEITSHRLEYAGRPARLVVAIDISERKQAETALRLSEQILARAQQIAHIGHWRWDLLTDTVTSSDELKRILGTEEERDTHNLFEVVADIFHPNDRARALQHLQAFLEQGDTHDGEYRIIRSDGVERVVWVIPDERIVDDTGKVVLLSGVMQDITERKQAEATQRLQAAALASAANGIMITNIDGVVEWVNPAFTALTGYTLAEASGHTPRELMYSGVHGATFFAEMWNTILAGKVWHGEITNRRKDGTLYIEEQTITPVPDEQGRISHFVSVKQDITARKQADAEREQLLRKTQAQAEQMEQIMRSVPEGILLLDMNQYILLANPLAETYLTQHLASAEVLTHGQPLTHLGDCPLARLLDSPPQGPWHTINGADRTFEGIAWPVTTEQAMAGWVIVLRDVTTARAIEQQLQRQERLAAIGQLAAGIAHDFNNIMSVISAYAQMLMQTPGLSERERERVFTIDRQSMRATQMIRQILDFSRRSPVERQPVDLLALLKEQVILLQQTLPENIEIELHAAQGDDVPYIVKGDPTRLQQMVMNLAVNARDASVDGGVLRFEVAHLLAPQAKDAAPPNLKPGAWLRLTVADAGVGMSPEIMEHIFEPFFTTKSAGEGTGLGLAQVHGIVAQHDGQITVTSRPGGGTRFDIFLPAATVVMSGMATELTTGIAEGHGEHVLVVEDHPPLRTTLVDLVSAWNYDVEAAVNGEDALAKIRETRKPFQLIISDVVMPKLGGVGLLRALRTAGDVTPLILLTGHPMGDELEPLRAHGLHGWLAKPPDAEQLSHMIADALQTTQYGA
ncbi:MAG TPA: PAS domain S-box protein [Chloroflexi bacterium]|nr:PAS domain S-box protein [Chloroflexota bacterium]